MESVYEKAVAFKRKYPFCIAWRLRKNASVIEKHLNDGETVDYVFVAQKNDNPFQILGSCVVALTNKRILIGRDRVVIGYFLDSVTPDLFNDLKVKAGIFFGKLHIDTIKEFITLSNIDRRALPEIETEISTFMMEQKQKYGSFNTED